MIPKYGNQLAVPTTTSVDVGREVRRRAVLAVCLLADDAADADLLLEVLGLRPSEGLLTDRTTTHR